MLINELDEMDTAEVLAAAAGIQLVDANIHHLFRLERLAGFAARQSGVSPRRLSASAVRRLLVTPEIGSEWIKANEDEFEGFITTEVPFFGGTFVVLQGLCTNSGVIARNLLATVFGSHGRDLPVELTRRVRWAAQLLLSTSATLAAQIGLQRSATAPEFTGEIRVPSISAIQELAQLVTFDESDLLQGFTPEAVDYLRATLIADGGDLPPWDGTDTDEGIIGTPFVRTARGIIVAAPFELMATLRHLIAAEAVNWSCADELTRAASGFAVRTVGAMFDLVCDDRLEEVYESSPALRVLRGYFDGDKLLDLRIRIETFDNYDPTTVFQDPVMRLGGAGITPADHPADKTLVLDVIWSHGSDAQVSTEVSEGFCLADMFETFEMILFAPGTHQLTLWYFAQAFDRWSSTGARMMMTSVADAYAIYDSGEEDSFYVSDDRPPTAMFIASGSAEELRQSVAQELGKTYVHQGNRVYEAELVHGTATTVRRVKFPGHLYFAEVGDVSAWVSASASQAAESAPLDALAEAVCYWLYKLGTEFPPLLVAQPRSDIRVAINVSDWEAVAMASPETQNWISFNIGDATGDIEVTVTTRATPQDDDPPNIVDRELVATLVRALVSAATTPVNFDCGEILEVIVPPGHRHMLHITDRNSDLVSWPGELPRPRKVISAVVAMLLDDLGRHLSEEHGRSVGPIPDAERSRVLNTEVVPYFGDRLSGVLDLYDDRLLLKYLIRANESLLREAHVDARMYPSRVACFGQQSGLVERMTKDMAQGATSAVSSRFLLEYLAANPAAGDQRVNTETYDLMLALASELTNMGFLSDAIHGGVSTATVSMLPSGRFGISREEDRWLTGIQNFLSSHASTTVGAIIETANAEHQPRSAPESFDLTEHDRLAGIEFGFTFTDMTTFVGELLDASIELEQHDVGELPISTVLERMTRVHGWDAERAQRILDTLSMRPEKDFWKLGRQVHPWRYNRERSYLRRPLIVRSQGESEYVFFGHRNAYLTTGQWYGQYESGRLQAKTPEMKKALAAARERKGDLFEIRVEAILGQVCSPVRRRVKRIGDHDLRNIDGFDLGDIDLVAYHAASSSLLLIEAKALEAARTPTELRNEIGNILEGDGSAVTRLGGRYEWARSNIDALRSEFALPAGKITLKPIIVIDDDLVTRQFEEAAFPIVPLDRLLQEIGKSNRTRLSR
ncbi:MULTISPECIES: hypothetical protein [unclassified Rhodococcus (in: high G+C Gram-positive bacteria)]|uniref:hypothetical protein n=1 Tax=unclassified Rhodococcus (in: high G+C Gram-positive bacteria) TaxID=192944 RepID=UPI00117A349A|nr:MULTISPECIES: hypothetical protein [unclassified Rhodococcus (in: high G+C Gram-positive bacteria)]